MSKLKIYGVAQSRAFRTLWMAEELGIDYEHVATHYRDGAKKEEYLKLNPNGRIPCIEDGGFVVWESMAINLYLAKKYGGDLAPKNLEEDAIATQWSFWVMTEVEKPLLNALFAATGIMGFEKNAKQAATYFAELSAPFEVLNQALDGKQYLMGNRFSVADLNVASVLTWAQMGQFSLADWPNMDAWLRRCLERPAAARARER